ncbi:DUF6328 family protein [Cellulomonas rhizosphaerae]|uniref:DUF6328 family protein n=1 Tax=Cellulomonas rhizosphaerae TaxID=2293719 RepID=UPI001F3295E9|nr:DUF6328 family protein [Cellulomonas rhizosphaerae]
MTEPDVDPTDGRSETRNQRADRNWDELLQELRVTQTGTQILMGFLLTIPFQQRFGDLDAFQRDLYLVLVVLAVVATALILAPVAIHRALFRRGMKSALVSVGDSFARAGLLVLALVLSGAAMLLFDVVVSRTAGVAMGLASLVVLGAAWWVLPRVVSARATAER